MTTFPDLPKMDPPQKGDKWTLAESWRGPTIEGNTVEIREGFRTDGASIPRVAWRVIGHPLQVPLLGPALMHDALYSAELLPQDKCDWLFLLAMKRVKISWAKRNAVWLAVRACGWIVWSKHTRYTISRARNFCELTIARH